MTAGAVFAVCGTAAGIAAWKLGVGPSCCATPTLTVTQYGDAVAGAGYMPEPDPGLAKIIACSTDSNKRAGAALLKQTQLTNGRRPDKTDFFPDTTVDGPKGSKVVRTKISITVSAGGTYHYDGWIWADVTTKPRSGRWCVDSWTPVTVPE